MMKLIPRSVKLATIVGMGLQIALVGMTSVKLVVPNKDTIVGLGDITNYQIWLSLFGLVTIGSLLYHQIEGGILIGIFIMTFATWYIEQSYPTQFVEFPNLTITPTNFIDFTNYDIKKCAAGIAAFLFIGLIDVSGVVFGMSSLANITKEDGSIPGSGATFVAVSVSTLFSAITGGTPLIVYVESATGIKEGGRTGLTAVFIGLFFLSAIFFAPVLGSIPLTATSPVAILIGAMMMGQAEEIDWENMSDAIPAFLTLIIMPFTFSITNGIVFGLISAFLFYITTGQFFTDLKALTSGYQTDAAVNQSELVRLNQTGQSEYFTGSGSPGHHRHSELVRSNSFMDNEPFVRAPSLILAKSQADAVRRARGMSINEEHNHQHQHGHQHQVINNRNVLSPESKVNYV
jgi:AGZA family xanthine/uracil permease-like MFS transporter